MKTVDLSQIYPKDPFHQHAIDGIVRSFRQYIGNTEITKDYATLLVADLRSGKIPVHPAPRAVAYADRIESYLRENTVNG